MKGYLGETIVDVATTPFAKYTKVDWALLYITQYAGIDGDHHKSWLFDTLSKILNDAPITIRQAKWSNGKSEYRFSVGDSEAYHTWVKEYEQDGAYSWDAGTPP